MFAAIRVDGNEVIVDPGDYHINAVRQYQQTAALSDNQIDEMIETGRIEFGLSTNREFRLTDRSDYVSLEAMEDAV